MISREDVKHIARLARIALGEKEIEKFQKDLESILNYMSELKGLDLGDIQPTSHVTGAENFMREDEVHEYEEIQNNQNLLRAAPDLKDGYVKTKAIL